LKISEAKVFFCSAGCGFASALSKASGCALSSIKVGRFSDGELFASVEEEVHGRQCVLIQSVSAPANDNLMELLLAADALKRAAAASVIAVVPYLGYCRQDKRNKQESIAAKLVANIMVKSGIDEVFTVDLHSKQIEGFFDVPVYCISGVPVFADYFKKTGFSADEFVVVAPDFGAVRRARELASILGCDIAIVDKHRPKANVSEVMNVIGEVNGKNLIIVDDIIDTAGTVCNASFELMERGARGIYVCASHAVLSGSAEKKIEKSMIKEMIFLNTIEIPAHKMIDKFKILDVSLLVAREFFR
jgi:ribose-phosphate pyrophosphokinase